MQSQLKLVEQLHQQARQELDKHIHERTQEKSQATTQIVELTSKIVNTYIVSLVSKSNFVFRSPRLKLKSIDYKFQMQMHNRNASS